MEQLVTNPINTVELNEQLIIERESQINNINKGVQEISELFQDMSMLVSSQGEQIDNIEININSAANNTEQANVQLIKAKKYQKKLRTRTCYCMIFLLVILIIIILTLLLSN